MRSTAEPRIDHDGAARVTTPRGEWQGAVLNVSVGGAFIAGVPALPRGTEVALDIELGDGEPPLCADGNVVWSRQVAQAEGPAGVALRFSRVAHQGVRRIARLVASRAQAPLGLLKRRVRVRLPGMEAPMRAVASDVTPETVMVESELSWLQLGAPVSTELGPNDVRNGRLRWVGVDVAPSGAARLRLAIDVSGRGLVSETPEEAAFFAGERAPLSGSGAYESMEMEFSRPRPRRRMAMLCGVLLGCAIGGGLSWAQPRYNLHAPQFVTKILSGHAARIDDEQPDPPPSFWRSIPEAQ